MWAELIKINLLGLRNYSRLIVIQKWARMRLRIFKMRAGAIPGKYTQFRGYYQENRRVVTALNSFRAIVNAPTQLTM